MPKHFSHEKYEDACSDPFMWIRKAVELRKAADVVWADFLSTLEAFQKSDDLENPFTGQVAIMLYGLAIENHLKAGLVAAGKGKNSSGEFNIKSHKIIDLAIKLGLQCSPEEYELLERLEHHITWAGRYPIPLDVKDLYPRDLATGGSAAIYGYSTHDRSRIEAIIHKIEAIVGGN